MSELDKKKEDLEKLKKEIKVNVRSEREVGVVGSCNEVSLFKPSKPKSCSFGDSILQMTGAFSETDPKFFSSH